MGSCSKKNEKAKQNILNFLKKRQISKLPVIVSKNDHFISSVIAAQIAFFYSRNQYQWRSKRRLKIKEITSKTFPENSEIQRGVPFEFSEKCLVVISLNIFFEKN